MSIWTLFVVRYASALTDESSQLNLEFSSVVVGKEKKDDFQESLRP